MESGSESVDRIAVLILTYNEEKHIVDCIRSAAFADEIIVIDSGSNDATAELAKVNGARVVVHPMEGFAAQRNFALEQTDAEWIFFLDADERPTEAAGKEIRDLVNRAEKCAYKSRRRNVVFGVPMHHGAHAPDWVVRLSPREAMHWEGLVHESAEISVPVKKMQEDMIHYTYDVWETYLSKFNRYTSLAAQKQYNVGKRASIGKLLLDPPFTFVKMFFLKAGFLDGFLGFAMSVMAGLSVFMKYMKLAELERLEKKR